MSKQLNPCPICGSFNIAVTPTRIMCYSCGVAVHADDGYQINDFYFDRWNALPRRLRWKKEKPTHSEIYYFRNEDGKCLADVNVEEGTVLLLNWDAIADLDELEGEWAGPIQEPDD